MARARRGRGEGSVSQRPDGTWRAELSLGFDPRTGKRDRRTVYGRTKDDVLIALEKLRVDVESGRVPRRGSAPKALTLGVFLEQWLADDVTPNAGAATARMYELCVKRYIKPHLGALKLDRVTPLDVQHLHRVVAETGAGARTRQAVHSTIARALRQAVRWQLIPTNPAAAVDAPRYRAPAIKPLDPKQVGKLLAAAAGDRLETLYQLAIATGMRQGEMFGLQWEDVDLAAGTLHVRHSLADTDGHPKLGAPKTRSSRRQISLGSKGRTALDRHRKAMMAEGHGSTYVFCDRDGGPLRRSNFLRRSFRPLLETAKLPETIRFHDLRHTTATMLLAHNVHPKIVQEILGHAKITTTLDTYSHAVPTMHEAALARLDRQLRRAQRDAVGGELGGKVLRRVAAAAKKKAPKPLRDGA